MRPWAKRVPASCILFVGCSGPLDIRYETEHLKIGTAFERPLCQGDLDDLEAHVSFVAGVLGSSLNADVEVYLWESADELDCPTEGTQGCFHDRRFEIRATPQSVDHELVHAVASRIERHPDLAFHEGIAEALAMDRTIFGSTLPTDNLDKAEASFVHYATVGHFSRWLLEEHGPSKFQALLESRDRDPRAAFDEAYGRSMYEEQDRYLAEVPWVYPRYAPCPFPELETNPLGWTLEVTATCSDPNTRSSPDGLRLSRVFLVEDAGYYDLVSNQLTALALCTMEPVVEPVPEGLKSAFHDPDHEGLPSLIEPIARQYPAHEIHTVYLRAGLHLVELRAGGWDDTEIIVQIERSIGERPATPPPYLQP